MKNKQQKTTPYYSYIYYKNSVCFFSEENEQDSVSKHPIIPFDLYLQEKLEDNLQSLMDAGLLVNNQQ